MFYAQVTSEATTLESCPEKEGYLKAKILMLVVAAMLLVGSAVPAFAQRGEGPGAVCEWDWDRYLWRVYEYELWYYYCDYGDDEWTIAAFWTPEWGFWWN